jgi:hypothetical protein
MSKEYAAALEAHNLASKAFNAVRDDYRAGKVGDAEFLAARNAFHAATAIYDAAFTAEVLLGEGEAA